MKRSTRDIFVSVAVILLGFAVIIGLLCSMGCATARPECPPIITPEVIEVPVVIPPPPFRTPTPPVFVEPVTIEDIARNWIELVRAWRDALAIIENHNAAIVDSVE